MRLRSEPKRQSPRPASGLRRRSSGPRLRRSRSGPVNELLDLPLERNEAEMKYQFRLLVLVGALALNLHSVSAQSKVVAPAHPERTAGTLATGGSLPVQGVRRGRQAGEVDRVSDRKLIHRRFDDL